MICRVVLSEQRAELSQAIKFTFQDKSLGCTDNDTLVGFDPSPRIVAIQLFVLPEEVVGKTLDVPPPYDKFSGNSDDFFCHYLDYISRFLYSYTLIKTGVTAIYKGRLDFQRINKILLVISILILSEVSHNSMLGAGHVWLHVP